jgi:hypothetical protein
VKFVVGYVVLHRLYLFAIAAAIRGLPARLADILRSFPRRISV